MNSREPSAFKAGIRKVSFSVPDEQQTRALVGMGMEAEQPLHMRAWPDRDEIDAGLAHFAAQRCKPSLCRRVHFGLSLFRRPTGDLILRRIVPLDGAVNFARPFRRDETVANVLRNRLAVAFSRVAPAAARAGDDADNVVLVHDDS